MLAERAGVLPRFTRALSTARQLPNFHYSGEVEEALAHKKPVVAFETTIATHGLPHPERIDVPLRLEGIARSLGVVPATISIINGQIHIGTSASQLEQLVTSSNVLKLSRRDLPVALAKSANGGTTVAATTRLAALAGIKFFATGGIGGVHRNGENTLDVSADLTELASQPVGVVCAGPKSILDIPRTLEYLETQSVPVVTWKSKMFPAFYAKSSGLPSPATVDTAFEAAQVYRHNEVVGSPSGVLFGVPIPDAVEHQAVPIQKAVEQAVLESEANGMSRRGKESTPWLLDRVKQLTKGKSVESNIALIENNTRVACDIASAYFNGGSQSGSGSGSFHPALNQSSNMPSLDDHASQASLNSAAKPHDLLLVGSAAVDVTATTATASADLGSTSPGSVEMSPGGVARNIAEAAARLGCSPVLLAGVGSDSFGDIVRKDSAAKDIQLITLSGGSHSTAVCTSLLDGKGDLIAGVAAMDIAEHLDVSQLSDCLASSDTTVLAFDGNISTEAMGVLVRHAQIAQKQLFFEPTSIQKSIKPLSVSATKLPLLHHITPNAVELAAIWKTAHDAFFETAEYTSCLLSYNIDSTFSDTLANSLPSFVRTEGLAQMVIQTLPLCGTIWLKLGSQGCLVGTRAPVAQAWHSANTAVGPPSEDGKCVVLRYYPAQEVDPSKIVSVIGAGDNFAAGLLSCLTKGPHAHQTSASMDAMVSVAQSAAISALQSKLAVNPDLAPDVTLRGLQMHQS